MDQDKRIKLRLGDNCSYICDHPENENLIIVSDGEYQYSTSKKHPSKNLSLKTMTPESKLKYWNAKCTNDVEIISFLTEGVNIVAEMRHVPTNYKCSRWIRKDNISNVCRLIKKEADPTAYFKEEATLKYGDVFDFSLSKYIGFNDPIDVICKEHGLFKTIYRMFLNKSKHGCPECGREARQGFSKTTFIDSCKGDIGYIYILECHNENEEFLKIGVSSKTDLKDRFGKQCYMPYEYVTLLQKPSNPEFIFNLEHEVHRAFKQNKYVPLLSFHGYKECFDISIKQQAISLIENLLVSLPDDI